MGILKTKQPKLLKEFIWPAKMIHINQANQTPPLTLLSRASSMRSVHTEHSTQLIGRVSPVCLVPQDTLTGFVSFSIDILHPPSCVPSLHNHYVASSLLWTL